MPVNLKKKATFSRLFLVIIDVRGTSEYTAELSVLVLTTTVFSCINCSICVAESRTLNIGVTGSVCSLALVTEKDCVAAKIRQISVLTLFL